MCMETESYEDRDIAYSSSGTSTDELTSTEDGSTDGDGLSGSVTLLELDEVVGSVAEHAPAHEETRVAGDRLEAGDGLGWA